MRKLRFNFLTPTFILVIAFSFSQNKTPDSKLKVYVDERMEFLTTVQYLADYFLISRLDLDYKKEIDSCFGKYKTHPAVTLIKTISEQGYFNGSSAPWYLYHFSFPDFKTQSDFVQAEHRSKILKRAEIHLQCFGNSCVIFMCKQAFMNSLPATKNIMTVCQPLW